MKSQDRKDWGKRDKEVAAVLKELDSIFADLASRVGSLGATSAPSVDKSKPFSLTDYPLIRKRVDDLIKRLARRLGVAIVSGIRSAWTLANKKYDALCDTVFGDKADGLTADQRRRYYTSNGPALDAFLARKVKGLSLSERVWNYAEMCVPQIEATLELGIKTGEGAAEIARDLKTYLRFPDKLFRRVRDKKTGELHLSKAASEFHPGQGVYRSSYANAYRLARTETNIAYNSADYLRRSQLDFVVGIEVHLSNNHTCLGPDGKPHPFYDICDELQGKYPKWFVFKGWHPACRCFTTSILKTDEEIERDLDGTDRGSVNTVKRMPPQWDKWLEENRDRVARAEQRGTLPYFLTDNPWAWKDGVEMPTAFKPALVRAQERHAARTPEQIADIKARWNERQIAYNDTALVLKLADSIPGLTDYWGEDFRTVRLNRLREQYTGGVRNYAKLHTDATTVLSFIRDARDELSILDNPLKVMQKWGIETAYTIKENVERTMRRYSGETDKTKAEKYRYEALWIEEHRKDTIPTWKEAQAAYLKAAREIEWRLEWEDLSDRLKTLARDPLADASLVAEARSYIGKNMAAAQIAVKDIEDDMTLRAVKAEFDKLLREHPKLMQPFVSDMQSGMNTRSVARVNRVYNQARVIIDEWDEWKDKAILARRKVPAELQAEIDEALASDEIGKLMTVTEKARLYIELQTLRTQVRDIIQSHGEIIKNYDTRLYSALESDADSSDRALIEADLRLANGIVNDWFQSVDGLIEYGEYDTKGTAYKALLAEGDARVADNDLRGLKDVLSRLKTEKERLEREKAWQEKVKAERKEMAYFIAKVKALGSSDADLLALLSAYDANSGSSKPLGKAREAFEAVKARLDALGLSISNRVTLEDLKRRLGKDMPKSLVDLQKSIDSYEQSYMYGDAVKRHKKEIEDTMLEWLSKYNPGMNVGESKLSLIRKSWFKCQFETGTGEGYVGGVGDKSIERGGIPSDHSRLKFAHRFFLGDAPTDGKHQLKRREYEKYGNLMDTDILTSLRHNPGGSYGRVQVRFKRDKVLATFTPADSLGGGYQPSLITDPKACSFDRRDERSLPIGLSDPDFKTLFSKCVYSYLELQFHGDLTVDCVESLAYPYDLMESWHSSERKEAEQWKAIGVTIYYIDANGKLATL